MISKQTDPQIQILVYDPHNGKTSNFFTSKTSQEVIYQEMSQSIHEQRYHPVATICLSRVNPQLSISIMILLQSWSFMTPCYNNASATIHRASSFDTTWCFKRFKKH